KTPPAVVLQSRLPAANSYGWNNTDVTATFKATDTLSGIDGSDTAAVRFTQEGADLSASQSFTDKAGNTAAAAVSGINIDKTAPSISASPSPAPNANGWNKTD